MKDTFRYPDVDRGWAWVALLSCYVGFLLCGATSYMNGVLYVAVLEKFQEGKTKTALIGALSTGVFCLLGPVVSSFFNKFGCRPGIILGSVILTSANVLSAFMPSVNGLIISAGVMAGVGYSFIFGGGIVCVAYYFDKFRDRFMSLMYIILGIGLLISSPVCLWLLERYGLTGTYLIIGCLNAQMCIAGVVCRPSSLERKGLMGQQNPTKAESLCTKLSKSFNFSILRKKDLILFLLSSISWSFALTLSVNHLPNYMVENGANDADILAITTTFAVANVSGRTLAAMLAGIKCIDNIHLNAGIMGVCGSIIALSPLYMDTTFGKFIFCSQLGLASGGPNAISTIICIRLVGKTAMAEANGLVFFSCGIGSIMGPVLAGFLLETIGSYLYSFMIVGIVLMAGSVCSLLAWVIHRKVENKDSDMDTQPELELFVSTDKQ